MIIGSSCITCDPSCNGCTGPSPNQCSSCYSGKYLKVDDNTCATCTAPGYYIVSATQTCELCDASCKTCNGPAATNCLTCYTGKYLLAANNSCVSCNIDGYYQDTGTQTCKLCDTSCKTCSGTAATNCLSCPTGKYLLAANNSCVSCDVDGYFQDTDTQTCKACHASCKTCSGTASTNCLSCYSGKFFLASNNSCVSCNVDGYYQDTIAQTCHTCDLSCQTCSGSAATSCLTCYSGKYMLTANNSCVSCNINGYYQDTLTQTCEACDASCKTCSGSAATNCLSCYSGKYLLTANNSCVSCDVVGYFQDAGTQTCKACDSSCKTCSGSSAMNCLSCYSGKFFLASNNSCVSCNEDGYYQNTIAQTCDTCDLSCQTCSGSAATNCLTCYTGQYLLAANSSCVSCDVDGYYQDTLTQTCKACDASCNTCSGSTATNCLSCPTGKYLLTANNSCVSCNVDGYYQDTLTQTCKACDAGCKTCSGPSATDCLTCYSGTYLLSLNNSCVSCNVDGYFADTSTQTCQSCDPSCKTCTGSSDTSCLSCYSGKYWLSLNNSCVDCSINGYFIDVSTQACIACDPSCQTCSGSSATNCLSCFSGKYMLEQNNSCLSCDVDGYYQDTSTQTCQTCDSSCKTCTGSTASNCLSCYSGMQLNQSNSCINKTAGPYKEYPHLTVALMSTASTTQAALQVQSATTSLLPVLIRGASTTAILMVNFVSDVLLFRFINVPFPGNFVDFCKNLYSNLLPNFYLEFEDRYNTPRATLGKFGEFAMSSVMFGNCGNTLDRECIALALIFVLIFLPWTTKKFPKAHSFFKTLRDVYKWNIFLTFFMADFGELYLFSMLQLKENRSRSWYAFYGKSVSIGFIGSYPILIAYFIYLLNRKAPPKIGDEVKPEKQPILWREVPKSVNMISTDFKTDHWIKRNFLLLTLLENFLNDLIYLLLQYHGSLQAILYTGITVVFLILGLTYRPYTTKLQNFLFGFNYTFKLLLGVLAIYIGLTQTASEETPDVLGLALIGLIVTAIASNAVIVLGILLSKVIQALKARLKKKSQVKPLKTSDSPTISIISPMKIESLDNPQAGPFNALSDVFKGMLTPISMDRAETPNVTLLSPSAKRMRIPTPSSTRLLSLNLSESGEANYAPSNDEANFFARTEHGQQRFERRSQDRKDSSSSSTSSESQFQIALTKIRSRRSTEKRNGTKVIRFNFDG